MHVREAWVVALLLAGASTAWSGRSCHAAAGSNGKRPASSVARTPSGLDLLSAVQLETEVKKRPGPLLARLARRPGTPPPRASHRSIPRGSSPVVTRRVACPRRHPRHPRARRRAAWPLWKRAGRLLPIPPIPPRRAGQTTSVRTVAGRHLRSRCTTHLHAARAAGHRSRRAIWSRPRHPDSSSRRPRSSPLSGTRWVFDGATPDQPIDSIPISVDGLSSPARSSSTRQWPSASSSSAWGPPAGRGRATPVEMSPITRRRSSSRPRRGAHVSSRRRVELAYSVEDDHGIRGDGAGLARRRRQDGAQGPPLGVGAAAHGAGEVLRDLNEAAMTPGSRIAYHLEPRKTTQPTVPTSAPRRSLSPRVLPARAPRGHPGPARRCSQQLIGHLADRRNAEDELVRHRDLPRCGRALCSSSSEPCHAVDQDTLAPRGSTRSSARCTSASTS